MLVYIATVNCHNLAKCSLSIHRDKNLLPFLYASLYSHIIRFAFCDLITAIRFMLVQFYVLLLQTLNFMIVLLGSFIIKYFDAYVATIKRI